MALALVRPDTLHAWRGPSMLVVDTEGACGAPSRLTGFYFRETRYLSELRLEIDGERLWRCEAAAVAPEHLEFTYVHPEISEPGGGGSGQSGDEERTNGRGIPERTIDIVVRYRVRPAALEIATRITNRSRQPIACEAAWRLGADFADLLEAQGSGREQDAPVQVEHRDGCLAFAYRHPDLPHRTHVLFASPPSWRVEGARLVAPIDLRPQEATDLVLRIEPVDPWGMPAAEEVERREAFLQRWQDSLTRCEAPANRVFERVLLDNVRDIASYPLLEGEEDEWLTPSAGIPLYPAFFGRDGVTAGWQAAWLDGGRTLDAALTRLGRLQSTRVNDWNDEEPGRLPYQVRSGPLARLGKNPFAAYYADFASPLMYVISLANLFAWTDDTSCLARHWDTARRILDWAREYGDSDGDGYLEYQTRAAGGVKNQGWKDSGDAIVYDDGRPVPVPIATCDIQGYWFLAQELMAVLCLFMNAPGDARAHLRRALDLKARFNRDWWVEEERCFALALDPEKRRVGAVTSNVGHCLACGIIDADHLPPVVGRLFAPDMFSGWGIRTLSSEHRAYNPLSYHRGSVWAVEQATIMFGLRRFGFDARAIDLASALFDLALLYPEHRIPECVGGYARAERPVPGAYPRANTPQLWNGTAFPLTVQTLLGLLPLAPAGTLVVDPLLPEWLPELLLHELRVGGACVSLRFWREEDGRSSWEVLQQRGTLRILRQPPPEASAGWWERARGLMESVHPGR